MKQCPKCENVFDDTWGACLHCRTDLVDYVPEQKEPVLDEREFIEEEDYQDMEEELIQIGTVQECWNVSCTRVLKYTCVFR